MQEAQAATVFLVMRGTKFDREDHALRALSNLEVLVKSGDRTGHLTEDEFNNERTAVA